MIQETDQNMQDFLIDIENRVSGFQGVFKDLSSLDSLPLLHGQAMYVMNWSSNTVSYQRGVRELLGYEKEEFSQELITTYFHPDDLEVVTRLVKAAVNYVTSNPVTLQDFLLNLTYRAKKKNGEYIKILRQSAMFELSEDNMMISNYSMISDISFMNTGNRVEWEVHAGKMVKEEFERHMFESYKDFFSARENEVLDELKNGNSSKQIGARLHISSHTVDTHRRKMLKKAGCRNTVELLNFAKKSGNL